MIRFYNEDLEDIREHRKKIIAEKGEDFDLRISYMSEKSKFMPLLSSLYSSGAPLEEIKALLPDVLITSQFTRQTQRRR
jgi:hypothetical protein